MVPIHPSHLSTAVAAVAFTTCRTSSFCNFVDLEWDDSVEFDVEEIDRLIANANTGK